MPIVKNKTSFSLFAQYIHVKYLYTLKFLAYFEWMLLFYRNVIILYIPLFFSYVMGIFPCHSDLPYFFKERGVIYDTYKHGYLQILTYDKLYVII